MSATARKTSRKIPPQKFAPSHSATPEEQLAELRAEWKATFPHLATKADIAQLRGDMLKWFIATGLTIVGVVAAMLYGALPLLLRAAAGG